ncbi:MAG: hypothetical protein RL150_297 [Candidatus Parcubacteria bacterium]|jgi:ATPase subunit of ABC transporter with duplicated ATPase domains
MLRVIKLSKYFGDHVVLNKISFNLERGNKVALTGFNGSGKTTLLRILAGEESYSNGVLQARDDTKIAYVPQDPHAQSNVLVKDILASATDAPDDAFWRKVSVFLAGFMLPEQVLEQRIGSLSSGQKTKVFLAQMLLQDADLLLLDEPTNNLDLPALIWLEDYLQTLDIACIIVSHDRAFLDAVSNKVFEIDWHTHELHVSNARYSDYLAERAKEHARLTHEHELQQEELGRLKQLAVYKQERGRAGSSWKTSDNDKMLQGFKQNRAGKSFHEAKITYRRIKRMDFIAKPQERRTLSLAVDAVVESGTTDIVCKDIICGYEHGFSVGPFSLDARYGRRICIVGPNGSGKTTILKTITGMVPPKSGERHIGSGVRFGNFMQEHESLPKDKTAIGFLRAHIDADRELIQNHLLHFGISEVAAGVPIKALSPGNRARLLFAYFAAMQVNTLILDEPTNHLDVEATAALEEALRQFSGTIIAVSHDRRFVEAMQFDGHYVVTDAGVDAVADITQYVDAMERRAKKLVRMLKP